jgi:hypothetical protein
MPEKTLGGFDAIGTPLSSLRLSARVYPVLLLSHVTKARHWAPMIVVLNASQKTRANPSLRFPRALRSWGLRLLRPGF